MRTPLPIRSKAMILRSLIYFAAAGALTLSASDTTRPAALKTPADEPKAIIDESIIADESSERVGFEKDPDQLEAAPSEIFSNTGIAFLDGLTAFIAPRTYYRYVDYGDGTKEEAFATGGTLGFKSGNIQNFAYIRVTAHTSQKLYGPEGRDGTGLLRDGQKSYTDMGEANLTLHTELTELRLGRQRIDIPYLNSNDTRMTPNIFDAYMLKDADAGHFNYTIGYVDKIRERTGTDYYSPSDIVGVDSDDNGIYTFGIRYIPKVDFNTGIVALNNPDIINILYGETHVALPWLQALNLTLGLQATDQRSVGDDAAGEFEAQQFGLRFQGSYEKWMSTLVYTHTTSKGSIQKPWSGSPSYNAMMISDFDRAGENAIGGSLNYRFSGKPAEGFVTSMRWTYGDTPDSGRNASPDEYEINWNFDYYPKEVENLRLRLRFARNKPEGESSIREMRFIVNYVKTF